MYSFNGNKTATAGGGGAIAGNDEKLVKHFRHLTTTARVGAEYDHDIVGYNYRMTNLQAAVGCAQMERLDEFVAAKRRIADTYDRAFRGINGFGRFPDPEWAESPAWFSGFFIGTDDGDRQSAELRAYLRSADIDARPFWKPMHQQPPYASAPHTQMPVCDWLWSRIVTLPCSTHLTEADQEKVIDAVIGWTRKAAA
jgi:dTDP-4-amino-4,6-dideoxygalactose transaminase